MGLVLVQTTLIHGLPGTCVHAAEDRHPRGRSASNDSLTEAVTDTHQLLSMASLSMEGGALDATCWPSPPRALTWDPIKNTVSQAELHCRC